MHKVIAGGSVLLYNEITNTVEVFMRISLAFCGVLSAMVLIACGQDTEGKDAGFAEIGRVVQGGGSTNIDFSKIDQAGSALSLANDEFAIIVDFSDSWVKPSQYLDHKPVLVGDFGCFTNSDTGTWMSTWNSERGSVFSNSRMTVSTVPDVYYIKLKGTLADPLTVYLKYGLLLDTIGGRTAFIQFDEIFWGAFFPGMECIKLYVDSPAGSTRIDNVLYHDAAVPAAKIGAAGKWVGMIANTALIQPGVQTVGYESLTLKAGSRVRLLWTDMPSGAAGDVPNGWEDYPQNARVTGWRSWLLSDTNFPWHTAHGGVVEVDLANRRAAYTTTLQHDEPAYFEFMMVNAAGWDAGNERWTHGAFIPAVTGVADYTVKVKANFRLEP